MSDTDPITQSVIVRSLTEFCAEIADVLTRTARNPALSLAHDFSVAITDGSGNIVTGEEGIPVHLGSIGMCVEAMADLLSIEPGDVLLTNDPYEGMSTHMADFTIGLPVFADGDDPLVWIVIRAHQADIGAIDTGAMAPRAKDIYDEGIRLPPLKIAVGGEERNDIIEMVAKNSRVETVQRGDLQAMIGAAKTGERLVERLVEKYNPTTIQTSIDRLLQTTEETVRDRVRELPDETYRGESRSDTNPATGEPVRVAVEITVDGDRLIYDFSGSDQQVESCINNSLAVTHAAVNFSWISALELDFPMNAGAFEMIEVIAPDGSVVNPEFPHATSYATLDFFQETAEACWKAVSEFAPNISAGYSRWVRPITSGLDPGTGEQYTTYQLFVMGGGGAVEGADGANAIGGFDIFGGLAIVDPELHEALFPFHIHELDFRTDSGGAGNQRGGVAPTFEVSPVDHTATFSIGGDFGQTAPPFGIRGGKPGEPTRVQKRTPEGTVEIEESFKIVSVGEDETYVQHSGGGGGVGDPHERDPERVREDVRNGYVSVQAARDEYGVVFDDEGEIDYERTRSLRGDRCE